MSTVGLAFTLHTLDSRTKMVWTAAIVAWLLAVPLYGVTKFADVVAHEGGHALAAKIFFRRVHSIEIDKYGGGITRFSIAPWPFTIVIALAGYLGPSAFGLLAAWLLSHNEAEAVLWTSLAFLLVMLFLMRGFIGRLVVPVLMVLIFLIATRVKPPQQTLITYVWAWFLLIVAVESMIIFMNKKIYRSPGADTSKLRSLTLVPSGLWGAILLLATIVALGYGGSMLLQTHSG